MFWSFEVVAEAVNDESAAKNEIKPIKPILSLTINATSVPRIHFDVKPVKGFYTFTESLEDFKAESTSILEFVATGETVDNWTRVITLQFLRGSEVQAEMQTNAIAQVLSQGLLNSNIIKTETNNTPSYQQSKYAMQYVMGDGVVELIYMEYYSGPLDCAGIQYTEKLNRLLTKNEAEKRVREIEQLVSNIVTIQSF